MEPVHYLFLVLGMLVVIFGALAVWGAHSITVKIRLWFKRHVIDTVPPKNEDVFDSEQRPKIRFK